MCFLRVRPIGVMQMLDQGEQDDKVIAVHADDPEYKGFTDISQLPPHRLAEIRRCAVTGARDCQLLLHAISTTLLCRLADISPPAKLFKVVVALLLQTTGRLTRAHSCMDLCWHNSLHQNQIMQSLRMSASGQVS